MIPALGQALVKNAKKAGFIEQTRHDEKLFENEATRADKLKGLNGKATDSKKNKERIARDQKEAAELRTAGFTQTPFEASSKPSADSDAESSPGASDDEGESFGISPEFQAQSSASNGKKNTSTTEQQLHAELEAVTQGLEEAAEQTPASTPSFTTSATSGNLFTNLVGGAYSYLAKRRPSTVEQPATDAALVMKKSATPPKLKTKTQAELEDEQAQKLREMEQKQLEEARQEKLRLESEPQIAKTLRKAFAAATHVSVLLDYVFRDRRFGRVVTLSEKDYVARLQAETQSNATALASMHLFEAWKSGVGNSKAPSNMNEKFDFLSQWSQRIASLSQLWDEVLRFYAISENKSYAFSFQPLKKLNYFFEELKILSKFEIQFDAYMKNTSADESASLLAEKQNNIEQFIEAVNLFSARTMMLYKLLDSLKIQMERTEKLQRELRGEATVELPDEIIFDVSENDQEFQAVNPAWQVEVEDAEKNLKAHTKALGQLKASINYLDTTQEKENAQKSIEEMEGDLPSLQQRLADAQAAQPQWKLRFDAVNKPFEEKVKQLGVYQERVREHEEDGKEVEASLLALTKAEIVTLKKQLIPLQKELTAAQAEVESEKLKDIQAQRAAYDRAQDEKAVKYENNAEVAQQLLENNRILKELSMQANEKATVFLMEYAARPESTTLLTLSQSVRAPLSAVSIEMLQLWLSDQADGLSAEEAKWLSELITLEVRELAFSLRVKNSNVEILLEDKVGEMIEVLSIHLDGSVRGTLVTSEAEFLSLRTANAYSAEINQQHENLTTTLTAFKAGPSPVSERAVALLRAIANTKVEKEAHPHAQLAHMSKKTFALFGLYLLLYLQDAPSQNFADVDVYNDSGTSARPGAGSRLLRHLMKNVQQELGYHLRHCKEIYDAMERRATPIEKLKSGVKASSVSTMSARLEYLFNNRRSVKDISDSDNVVLQVNDYDVLVTELTGRYLEDLTALVRPKELSPILRERLVKVAEWLEQLPQRGDHRLRLMNYTVVQLVMLRDKIYFYQNDAKAKPFQSFIKKSAQSIGAVKDNRAEKLQFLIAVFDYLLASLVRDSHEKVSTAAAFFIRNLYEAVVKKTATQIEEINTWLEGTIFVAQDSMKKGGDTLKAVMWLSNSVLDELLTGCTFRAARIRELAGCTYENFQPIAMVDANTSNHSGSNMPMIVERGSELFITLACQAAVLEHHEQVLKEHAAAMLARSTNGLTAVLEEKKDSMIMIASKHSWFLQLRFLQAILIEKKTLPIYNAQASTPMYRRERDMLNVFDNMMTHLSELPNWVDVCFKDARADVRQTILKMSDAEKIKMAFVLMAEFFSVIFIALSAIALSKGKRAEGDCLAALSAHMNGIKTLAGFSLNEDCESVLFSLAADFLLKNPELLQNSRITSGAIVNGARSSIKNADSALDAYFTSTAIQIGIEPESDTKRLETLVDKRVGLFVHDRSRSLGSQEAISVNDAINRVKT